MPTECRAELFDFAPAERRAVIAPFDGGAITSDAGRALLAATDRVIRQVDRGQSRYRRMDQILQRDAPSPGAGLPHADGGMAPRFDRNRSRRSKRLWTCG